MTARSGKTGVGLVMGFVCIVIFAVAYARSCSVQAAEPLRTEDAQKKLEGKAAQREAEANSPPTRAEIDVLRKQIAALADELAALQKKVRELEAARPASADDGDSAPSRDDVRKAIVEGRIIVGMTYDEVNQAFGTRKGGGHLIREQVGGYKDYEWVYHGARWYATLRNDRVISCEREGGGSSSSGSSGTFNPFGAGR